MIMQWLFLSLLNLGCPNPFLLLDLNALLVIIKDCFLSKFKPFDQVFD